MYVGGCSENVRLSVLLIFKFSSVFQWFTWEVRCHLYSLNIRSVFALVAFKIFPLSWLSAALPMCYHRQPGGWTPIIPTFWYLCSCVIPSWVWAGITDLVLMNRIWQKWWFPLDLLGFFLNSFLCKFSSDLSGRVILIQLFPQGELNCT